MTITAPRESIAGAVGLPIAILALTLAIIPPIVFYVAWIPGVVALIVGIVGIVRTHPPAPRRLAIAATAVAGASFIVSAGWFALGWVFSNVLVECLAPSCL